MDSKSLVAKLPPAKNWRLLWLFLSSILVTCLLLLLATSNVTTLLTQFKNQKYLIKKMSEVNTNTKLLTEDPYYLYEQTTSDIPHSKNTLYDLEQRALELGCYIFSETLMRYVTTKSHLKIPQLMILDANSSNLCLNSCYEKFMYAHFFPQYKRCACSNVFKAEGLSYLPCGSNTHSAVVFLSGAQDKVKYSYLISRGVKCNCTNSGCTHLQCELSSQEPHATAYWVSPKQPILNTLSTNKCNDDTVVFTSMQNEKSICFNRSYVPLLPISSREAFHMRIQPSTQTPQDGRIYYLKGKPSGKFSIPLTPRLNRTKIALVTYMRSGSTFFSEFFKAHPDAFYLFEPLGGITSTDIISGHETFNYSRQDIIASQSVSVMDSLFDCKFNQVPLYSFTRFWVKYDSFIKYCNSESIQARLSCLQALLVDCLYQPMTVMKFIRAKVSWMLELIKGNHTELKVILLLRDPRGIINSRRHMKKQYIGRTMTIAYELCSAMVEDIRVAQELAKSETYRKQIYVFRYEDLVGDIVSSAEKIYSAMELGSVPSKLKEYLESLSDTSGKDKVDNGFYGTRRKDSMKVAFDWKKQLPQDVVPDIDKICEEAYSLAGYEPIASAKDLLDEDNFHYIRDHHIL